jgi:hypothetical protein
MSYWVCEHRTVEQKAVIHRGDCPDCRSRLDHREQPAEHGNGLWHGPFETINAAAQAAVATGRSVRQHDCTR